LLASAAVALAAGVGAGMWLGRSPAVSLGGLSGERDVAPLRLDEHLSSPAPRGQRGIPREQSRP